MTNRIIKLCPIVYLAGGINGLSDADCKDWREQAKKYLPRTLDPMRRDYRGKEADSVGDVVHGDLIDIAQSNLVLAMCPRPSWGTAMEIHFAGTRGMPVFSIVPQGPVSPWLAYYSTVCSSLEAAIAQIKELFTW